MGHLPSHTGCGRRFTHRVDRYAVVLVKELFSCHEVPVAFALACKNENCTSNQGAHDEANYCECCSDGFLITPEPSKRQSGTYPCILDTHPDKERSRDAFVLAVGVVIPATEAVSAVVTTRVVEGAAMSVEGTEVEMGAYVDELMWVSPVVLRR